MPPLTILQYVTFHYIINHFRLIVGQIPADKTHECCRYSFCIFFLSRTPPDDNLINFDLMFEVQVAMAYECHLLGFFLLFKYLFLLTYNNVSISRPNVSSGHLIWLIHYFSSWIAISFDDLPLLCLLSSSSSSSLKRWHPKKSTVDNTKKEKDTISMAHKL